MSSIYSMIQDNAAIEKLKVHVRRSRRAGWMENLASIIFSDQRKKRKASEVNDVINVRNVPCILNR